MRQLQSALSVLVLQQRADRAAFALPLLHKKVANFGLLHAS